MRKLILSLLIASVTLLSSCDDFLEVSPRNTKVVKTVNDYRDILASYMDWLKDIPGTNSKVLGSAHNYPQFDLSDVCGIYTGELEYNESELIDPTTGLLGVYYEASLNWLRTDHYIWEKNYSFLGPINFIVDEIDQAQLVGGDADGGDDVRNYVKGEALVWRAYTLYKTLQYYSPYKNNELGIPLNLDAYKDPINATIKRSTQVDVFNQIIADCNEALSLLAKTPKNTWNFAYDKQFVHAMMASIFWYKAMSGAAESTDWGRAVEHADQAMKGRILTSDVNVLNEMFNIHRMNGYKPFETEEAYIRIIKRNFFTSTSSSIKNTVNVNILNNYQDDDIRKSAYFFYGYHNKYNTLGSPIFPTGDVFVPFRLADMYLIKAEALLRDNKDAEAAEVLNAFKQSRYAAPATLPGSNEELLMEVLKERQLEFYHENDSRWIDMKRLGVEFNRGEIGNVEFILKGDDFRYTFPIPHTEIVSDSDVEQNPGWDIFVN